jgi:hypothetical protein
LDLAVIPGEARNPSLSFAESKSKRDFSLRSE